MIKKQNDNNANDREMTPLLRTLPITCTFTLGILVSYILFAVVNNWEHDNQRIEFESRSKGYANAVGNTIHDYTESLRSVGDFFNNSVEVSREKFSGFVMNAITRHPGIHAFSWNPLVLNSERAEYEARAQEEGFENFMFTERTERKELVRAAQRDEYVVVYYIEPLADNKSAFGFNIASHPARLKAIKEGFDTGNMSATERITLVQETGEQFGVLLLLPVYKQNVPLKTTEDRRKHRMGFVVEVLRIGDFVESALKDFPDEGIDMYLYDLSAEEPDRFLYFRPSRTPGMTKQRLEKEEIQKGLYWSKNLDLEGRQWEILFSPSPFYLDSTKSWEAWIVLSGSLLLTCLLALYLARTSNYTAEIEKSVKKQNQTNLALEKEITDRKKAEEALRESEVKFRSVVESSPMGMHMYHLESDDRLVFAGFNQAADRILGVENSQFIGMTIEEAFPPLAATEIPDRCRRTAAQGESWMTEQITYEHGKISGAYQVHAFQTQPDKMVAMFLDVTEKMKVEKEQERLNEELITKNKELEQVLYVTSHDLRSPLVNVEGFSRELEYSLKELMSSLAQADAPSGIQERITPIVKEDIPQSLHYIQMSVSKMNTLLNGILTLSRLGRAELKIEEIDMNEMMTDIIDNHRFRLNESGIKTEIGKLPHCRGDISQINQVFSNLLDNAIKYADPERLCTVTISGYKDKNESVYCIADNGLGIAPEHQDRIFEIFHQLEPQRVKGEGMGLTIVHRIVEKHHGKIWVESELGRGSTFFVSLPS